MKREEALKQLEIMNAWAAGQTIQFRLKAAPWAPKPEFHDYHGGVNDESPAVFNTESYEWRIKPAPRVIYVRYREDGCMIGFSETGEGSGLVKFLEVIE